MRGNQQNGGRVACFVIMEEVLRDFLRTLFFFSFLSLSLLNFFFSLTLESLKDLKPLTSPCHGAQRNGRQEVLILYPIKEIGH